MANKRETNNRAEGRDSSTPLRKMNVLLRKPAETPQNMAQNGSPYLTRYIADGEVTTPPPGTSVTDSLKFSNEKPGRMSVFFYPMPSSDEITELANAWSLHPVLVEDLLEAHQRSKLERYGDTLFLVVRSARYLDDAEEVDFAEFHILIRQNAIAILCQDGEMIDGTPGIKFKDKETQQRVDQGLMEKPGLLQYGPEAIAYQMIDAIIDGYSPVLQGIEVDKEQIERQVFSGDNKVTERIYRLNLEVIDLQHTTFSLGQVLDELRGGAEKYRIGEQLQTYLQDVSDHLTKANTQVVEYRAALSQILNVNATLVAQRQNEDMKKISGWAAILYAPTLVAAIYGMNFIGMPELKWSLGYPWAIGLMIVLSIIFYIIFKRRDWL